MKRLGRHQLPQTMNAKRQVHCPAKETIGNNKTASARSKLQEWISSLSLPPQSETDCELQCHLFITNDQVHHHAIGIAGVD